MYTVSRAQGPRTPMVDKFTIIPPFLCVEGGGCGMWRGSVCVCVCVEVEGGVCMCGGEVQCVCRVDRGVEGLVQCVCGG